MLNMFSHAQHDKKTCFFTQSGVPIAGATQSATEPTPKKPRTNKHKCRSKAKVPKNRPPLIKNKPPQRGSPEWETFVPEFFTMGEAEELFSAEWQYVFEHRVTFYVRAVEDDLQTLIDPLPFGIELHRRVGYGARFSPADGMPGYIARVGVTTYKLCSDSMEWSGNKLVSVQGVSRCGKIFTRAYVWH